MKYRKMIWLKSGDFQPYMIEKYTLYIEKNI